MMIKPSTVKAYEAFSSENYAGLGALAEYRNVNDALYRGRTAEEIARMHAEFQGISQSQAAADPTIQLFINESYRQFATNPTPVVQVSPVNFSMVNQSTGERENWQRAMGAISREDAYRIASVFGASVEEEPKLLGQQEQDYILRFPNGLTVNATMVAEWLNAARTPEQRYAVQREIETMYSLQTQRNNQRTNSGGSVRTMSASGAGSGLSYQGEQVPGVRGGGQVASVLPATTATQQVTGEGAGMTDNEILAEQIRTSQRTTQMSEELSPTALRLLQTATSTVQSEATTIDTVLQSPMTFLIAAGALAFFLFSGGGND